MNNRSTVKQTLAALCALLLSALVIANVADAANVKLISVAEKEVVTTTADGVDVTEIVPAESVIPGEEVIYTTYYNNTSDRIADKIVITNQVPEHTRYKANSAIGADTAITYSVDGGKSFAAPEELMVTGKNGEQRVARPSEYTHIRWAYEPVLPPGEKGSVQFRVVLR
ncbi:MAG: hypothetical protein ACR2KU_01290 [Gammaproteobacteria bacterium]